MAAGGFGQRGTQRQAQTQVPALSQGQRQSLALLAMSLPELRAELFRQMSENVVIDEIEPTLERETISQKEDESAAEEREFASDYTEDDDRPETAYTADEDALERRQKFFDSQTREETLEEHLLNQLAMSDIDEKDIPLAEILIGELDDNGFFAGSVPDIVMVSGESERKIRAVLGEIRRLDPLGCGATTVEECLLAQLDKLDGSPYREEVRDILVRGHLKDVAAGRRAAVEADLGMSDERYDDVLTALRTLEPRPGRAYVRAGKSVTYVNPEVHARQVDGRWVARVDDRSLPDIRISRRYLQMLEDPKLPPETKAYIRERIAAAHAIAEAVARRQETITNIAQAIFDAQPGFFEKGLKGLKPLTMHEVAEKVGVHPATVSRTVNDKYVSTPKGTVELRKFFSQGFATADGGEVSKDEVAEKIRALIDGENRSAPLSDEKIARALAAAGLKVARRTVAKYRLRLGIPGTAERAVGSGAGRVALLLCCAALGACGATRVRYLDPCTQLWQTDDPREGRASAAEPGSWPLPNGLVDPLAKKLSPRILHSVYRQRETPFPDYDPSSPSPLFKINQVGYQPDQPKFAYLGAWLGPRLGAWQPHGTMSAWRIVDAASGATAYASDTPPVLRVRDAVTKEGAPFTGEETYEMDFSSVTNEGVYYVAVEGVGRSADFRIWNGAAEDAFRVHMGGLYQKRCGIAKTEPYTHWTAGACHTNVVRGVFAPEEGNLPKGVRWFDIIRHSTDWDGGERLTLAGGWHDAADYDRRPAHLAVVNDLCAAYLMRRANFRDGQLAIPENANGIPDILDEAEWGLRHLLAGQQADGGVGTWIETTGHPVPGNDAAHDPMRYALSRATRASSLAYAAHAALLARCHPAFREKYLASAQRAWTYALTAQPARKAFLIEKKKGLFSKTTETVVWEEPTTLPAQHLVKAAVNLHALTQDESYLDALRARWDETRRDFRQNEWRWSAWVFAGERALGLPAAAEGLMREWDRKVLNRARDMRRQVDAAYAYRCPWWFPNTGWCHAMSWGQSHPLRRAQTLVLAYEMTGEARYRDAAFAALDFHNGCNPQGTTLTSGLGQVYPVAFLDLPSYVDGLAEYVPGITPYRWTYGQPPKAVEWVYGGDKARAALCPIWRRWGNLENQTVAASEYTVWETIAPAAAVCGYLMTPTGTPPPVRPRPAADLRQLPGYWALP